MSILLKTKAACSPGISAAWLQTQELGGPLLQWRESSQLGKREPTWGGLAVAEVLAARSECGKKGLKAVNGEAIGRQAQAFFLLHGAGGLGGRDRIAPPTRALEFLILKQQWSKRLPHVPLHVVSQHTDQNVGTDAVLVPMTDRTHQEVEPFQAAKGLFHPRQIFIAAHRIRGRETFWGFTRPDHV